MSHKLDYHHTYNKLTQSWVQEAAEQGIDAGQAIKQISGGGSFDALGILERELLIQYGLQPQHAVIDVGCGPGRLAKPLAEYLIGNYLGTDVVPELVEHARQLANRPDWRFEVTNGLMIPEQDAQADLVCFFSVFTHLLHEQSFVYLQEAKRVLKPGGKIIFSFLEFAIFSHWAVFESNLRDLGIDKPLNMFMSRDAITAWAYHLGLTIEAVCDGDKPHIPLKEPLVLENGEVCRDLGNLGQSVCVLVKPV